KIHHYLVSLPKTSITQKPLILSRFVQYFHNLFSLLSTDKNHFSPALFASNLHQLAFQNKNWKLGCAA
ncbi:hypothetical protein, partial [Paenibacillus foliorum]|uniref:hypothetical protein n=1 Tax=Paenibacillus foliorum TaxID=2654974 RepID=UPI001C113649